MRHVVLPAALVALAPRVWAQARARYDAHQADFDPARRPARSAP